MITNFRDLKSVKESPKIIILRHDIDALPQRHLKLARIEKSLGIKSTYFVRVHGQYYYPMGLTLKVLEAIQQMGHEIGLHSEARSLSGIFQMEAVDLFKSEKTALDEALNIEVLSASEHGDLKHRESFWANHFFTKVSKQRVGIKHYPQEYAKYHYLSDSLQSWKEGCLCQNLKKYPFIQALIHAEWWGKDAKKEMVKLNKAYAKI